MNRPAYIARVRKHLDREVRNPRNSFSRADADGITTGSIEDFFEDEISPADAACKLVIQVIQGHGIRPKHTQESGDTMKTDAEKLHDTQVRLVQLRAQNKNLVDALKLLLADVTYHTGNSWSIGPCKDIPEGRLAFARDALARAGVDTPTPRAQAPNQGTV